MARYDEGGVLISPRFLDNTYNLVHTEWKITLGMARGRVALCSEQPSYLDVSARSAGLGIRICRTDTDWREALESVLSGTFDWASEQAAATNVVRRHYATSVVARTHAEFIARLMNRAG
jgi:hypothetical protein